MRVYLDNCAFNRPFDDQQQIRIRLEAEAKLYIQAKIKQDVFKLAWSYILDYENSQNPFPERRSAIALWRALATIDVEPSSPLIASATHFQQIGIKPKDALHLACAVEAQADYFITTDDQIIKKMPKEAAIKAINPLDFLILPECH